MSQPRSIEALFNAIERKVDEQGYYFREPKERKQFVKNELEEATSRSSHLRRSEATYHNYTKYQNHRIYPDVKAPATQRKPTSADYWRAAYDYDTVQADKTKDTALQQIMATGSLEHVTIGKLWGQITLRVEPCRLSLPVEDIPDDCPLDVITTRINAISYADGHPSKATSTAANPLTITPAQDKTLRRFTSLGYVVMMDSVGRWRRTGHVLVMDMDVKHIRHRQPWLVLASEWPRDADTVLDDTEGGDMFYADSTVDRNDRNQPGVFPGDTNRTPICLIQPFGTISDQSDQRPVLLRLGPNFTFEPVRFSSSSHSVKQSEYGPDLARGMLWAFDRITDQEVCYDANEQEYMRYDARTGRYHYPNLHRTSFAGEQGMLGELVDASTVPPTTIALLAPVTPPRINTGPVRPRLSLFLVLLVSNHSLANPSLRIGHFSRLPQATLDAVMPSSAISFLPALDISQVARMKVKQKAALITQLTFLIIFMETMLIDLVCFSDPDSIDMMIFKPVIQYLVNLNISGPVHNPLQGSLYYIDPEDVDFGAIRNSLYRLFGVFHKRLDLWTDVFEGTIDIDSNLVDFTTRPLSEIVMEAILMSSVPDSSRRTRETMGRLTIDYNITGSLENATSLTPKEGAFLHGERLDRTEVFARHNLNPSHNLLRMGSVACVSAVCKFAFAKGPSAYVTGNGTRGIRGILATGSTLIKWGYELGSLRIGRGTITLHEWFRQQRQTRFASDMQDLLNRLVGRYRTVYHQRVKQDCNYTELEWRALPGGQTKKSVKPRLEASKPRAVLGLNASIFNQQVNAILGHFQERSIGLAFSGHAFAMKPRCYACQVLYPFAWPHDARHITLAVKDTDSVAELDLNRLGGPCGCCAEALSFVEAMWHIGEGPGLLQVV
ncbi:MAG: hypothetical protein Q9210_003511 [Variospora velana]